MNKRQRDRLCDKYYKSLEKKRFNTALKQNRILYNEIFMGYLESNGNKEKLEVGLDRLEKEATEILPYIQLNDQEAK